MLASENYPSFLCRNGRSLRLVCSKIPHARSIYRAIKNKAPFKWETGLLSQSSFFYKNKWYIFIIEVSVSLPSNMCVCHVHVCVSLIEWGGWWTACHPVGTTTTASPWSLLAAAVPNGIFLEITASKCDMPLVFIFIVDKVCVRTVCYKAAWIVCACVRERLNVVRYYAEVQREHVPLSHGAGWSMTELSLAGCTKK